MALPLAFLHSPRLPKVNGAPNHPPFHFLPQNGSYLAHLVLTPSQEKNAVLDMRRENMNLSQRKSKFQVFSLGLSFPVANVTM